MEIEFNKTVIPCLRTVVREEKELELTQEVRLADGMPDIGRVLMSWGQLLVRGKEWRSSGMSVNGGVTACVLYEPEDGGAPQFVETWLPFQMKWDFPDGERDGSICINPLLRVIDARTTSARKMLVRSSVSVLAEAAVPSQAEVFSATELPEDICVLENTYPMQIPCEAGEKAFLIDEVLSLPTGITKPEKILRHTLQPVLLERKVMGDKVIFRGTANLRMVYLDGEGALQSWDVDLPFSQYAQLDRDYEPGAVSCVVPVVTSLELEPGEDGKYLWKAGLTGQYTIYDSHSVKLVEDAYSPKREVKPNTQQLTLPALLESRVIPIQPEQTMTFDGVRAVDAVFYAEHPRLYREGENLTAELGGTFQLLGYDSTGQLQSSTKRWEGKHMLDAAQSVALDAMVLPDGKVSTLFTGDGVTLTAQLPMDIMTVAGQGVPMVTGLSCGEPKEPDPDRPALILRRAGEDSLWQLAKQTGSTVESILSANGLQQEPEPGHMLLIPIV